MFALLSQASSQLESRYEKEALAVSGIGHPPTHYNSAGDLEDRYARVQEQGAVCSPCRPDECSGFRFWLPAVTRDTASLWSK